MESRGTDANLFDRPSEKQIQSTVEPPSLASSSEDSDVEKGERKTQATDSGDPNLVTWESVTDPMNPKNWRMKDKWIVTLLVSGFNLTTMMSSTIISPALPAIAKSLNITNEVLIQTSMSVFVLGYAFGPLFLSPLSEMYGRVVVVQLSNVWFVIWCIVSGFSETKAQMIASRLMAGIGGSAALSIGNGIVADVWKPEQRGRSLALYSFVPLLGPAIGPLIGGYIAQLTTWRWSFFAVAIFEAVLVLLALFTFKETYAPTILSKQAKVLRKETGNSNFYAAHEKENPSLVLKLRTSLIRPTKLLFTEPILQILALYAAFTFGLLYIVHSTYPTLWTDRYHQTVSESGLNFISIAVGFTLAAQIGAPITDRVWLHLRKKAAAANPTPDGSDPKIIPEYRVPLMLPGALLVPLGLLIYGWSAQAKTHWIVPNIGIAIFSGGVTIGNQCQIAYTVDAYPQYTASALASVTAMRSLAGFGFPLFAPQMYLSLGYGWGNTLIAGVAILIGIPMPWVLWKYGARIRARTAAP